MARRWLLLTIVTASYGPGAFGMLGISPLSPALMEGFALSRLAPACWWPARRRAARSRGWLSAPASDRWLTGQRSLWLALTAAVGAVIFSAYAAWTVSSPALATLLAFLAGVGAYGWVGVFFIISAEVGGRRAAGLLSGIAFAAIVVGLLVDRPPSGCCWSAGTPTPSRGPCSPRWRPW